MIAAQKVFLETFDLSLFQTEDFVVNIGQILLAGGFKIFLRNGMEQCLNIADG